MTDRWKLMPPWATALLRSVQRLIPNGRRLSADEFESRQWWLSLILGAHVPVLVIIGLSRRLSVLHLLAEVVVPLASLAFISTMKRLDTILRAIVTTTGLTVASSILVHLTDGLIESHFHFFVLVPLVTIYQHWTPFLVTIGWVLFHHGVVGVVEPASVYNHPAAIASPVKWAVVHAIFVVAASVASMMAWRRNEDERERTKLLLQASAQPLYGRATNGRITMASESLADLLGLPSADVLGLRDHDLLHAGPSESCEICARLADGTISELREPHLSVEGRVFPVEISSRQVAPGGAFEGVAVSFSDVTIRKAHEEDLRHRALHDHLTGLANRTLVIDQLRSALRGLAHGGFVGVLYVDLDGFKLVNDSYGHVVGDRLLIEIARRLQAISRQNDTPGRIGGDEFVMVLAGLTDAGHADVIAERVIERLSAPHTDGNLILAVTASVGLRVTDEPSIDPAVLLREADDALYVSKSRHRGCATRFDASMRTDAERQLLMARLLRGAAANGELQVVYQPQIDCRSGRSVGFEALCRWRSPDLGVVSPAEFIPLAERTGVIIELGDFVLTEAVRQIGTWSAHTGRSDLRMSVNISAHQLNSRALLDRVATLLAQHAVLRSQLVLEVTESMMVEPGTGALDLLSELRDLGTRVAVDDFGTGYSSLAALRTLPADELKIDRAFIHGLAADEKNQEMVRVVVAMANILGLEVTAEGAETPADVEAVRHLGCDLIQGFGVGRPQKPAEIEAWLDDPSHPAGTTADLPA